ncbi:MAG: SDR family oxidoreductase [Sphingobacteriales bacterium]|nr:MAG: SDR family oxidoreductase [Sphingobacteriales bacterium]
MNKSILITGSSSGIGKAAVTYFAGKGWNVIATMRNPRQDHDWAGNPHILVLPLDVQDAGSIAAAIAAGIGHFGAIDAVLNNAGYGEFGIFEGASDQQVLEQFDINVFGVMRVIRAILPHFRDKKSGMVINVSSGAGRFTLPLLSLYSASKFALEGFSEALSYELSAINVPVKIIEPGGTSTNFSNVTRENTLNKKHFHEYDEFNEAAGKMFASLRGMALATPEEVAAVIYEAATDGTDRLRYIVGNEDFRRRINDRLSLSDGEYLESVKSAYQRFM